MSPPKLPANRPVAFFAQPVQITFSVAIGQNRDFAPFDQIHRVVRKVVHFDKPLVGQIRFNWKLATVADGQIDLAIFDIAQQSDFVQVRDNFLASLLHREALIRPAFFVDRPIGIHDVDHWQITTLADFVVIGVVRRGNLNAPAALFGFGPTVGDQGNLAIHQRQHQLATISGHFT